jgi:hypothetical protein
MPRIHLLNKWEPNLNYSAAEVDTTSKGSFSDLSPFNLGPVDLRENTVCLKFENLWQYSKLYPEHAYLPEQKVGRSQFPWDYEPSRSFWAWRKAGFMNSRAVRYPMGKGVKPLYSYWYGERLNVVDARLRIYIPHYVHLVRQTKSYALLYKWYVEEKRDLVLRDFDVYDYRSQGMTLRDVVHNPKRSMGHAFVIKMMLKGELP